MKYGSIQSPRPAVRNGAWKMSNRYDKNDSDTTSTIDARSPRRRSPSCELASARVSRFGQRRHRRVVERLFVAGLRTGIVADHRLARREVIVVVGGGEVFVRRGHAHLEPVEADDECFRNVSAHGMKYFQFGPSVWPPSC